MPTVTLSTFTDFTQTGGTWGAPSLIGSASIVAGSGVSIVVNGRLVDDGTIPSGATISDVVIRAALSVTVDPTTMLGGNSKISVGINNVFSSTPDVAAVSADASPVSNSGTFTRDMGALTPSDLFSLPLGLRWSCGGGMGSPVDASGACTLYEVDVTYTAPVGPPTITSVVENSGPITGGTSVSVVGTNFVPNAKIYFGGMLATDIEFVSNTLYHCVTPLHSVGTVDVMMVLPGSDGTTP